MSYKKIDRNKKINLCFLGCGNITAKHARTLKKQASKVDVGFASRSSSKAAAFLKKHNGKIAYNSYEEALEDSWADVIMINLPPVHHFDWAVKALEKDKHVILEKPPLMKSSQFDELSQIAEPKRLQIMVAENYYYKPIRKKIKELIHSGIIGEPKFIHISATKLQKTEDWRDDINEAGFGALYEGGIHWISFIRGLGYEIKSATGFMPPQKTPLEKSIQAVFRTQNGPIINLLYSWEIHTLFQGLRFSTVYGSHGSIRWESNGITALVRGKKSRIYFPNLLDIGGKNAMFADFIDALYTGREPAYNKSIAKNDLKMVEEIYSTLDNPNY